MVLLAVYSRSQWSLMREVIKRLRAAGRDVGLIWFGSAGSAQADVMQQALALGCRYFNRDVYNDPAEASEATPKLLDRLFRRETPPPVLPADHPYRALVRGQLAGATRLLTEAGATILLVCEDGPGGDGSLIAAARARRLPVLVVPFGVGESDDYDVFLADKHREGNLNFVGDDAVGKFIRTHGSHWIRKTVYGDVLLFPDTMVAARLLEGVDLPQPWAVQGGVADRIAVESKAMYRHYLREGIPERKLQLVGTVYCDVTYDAVHSSPEYERAYRESRRIEPNRTSILVSLPPDYHANRAAQCDFPTYEEMCQGVLAFCSGLPNTTVTISIHPNSSDHAREAVLKSGLPVASEWLVSLIPKHDIFLTDFSSTIRWAIAAGKPVVNYDLYGFGLKTYASLPGVVTSSRFADIADALRRLTGNDGDFHRCASLQQAAAGDWGIMDGGNFSRLCALMDDLQRGRRTWSLKR